MPWRDALCPTDTFDTSENSDSGVQWSNSHVSVSEVCGSKVSVSKVCVSKVSVSKVWESKICGRANCGTIRDITFGLKIT